MPAGRPTKYREEFVQQAEKLCKLGATDIELADFFEVSIPTLWRWANQHEVFRNAIKSGKDAADDRVERSLYHRACGYTFDAVKIFMPAGASEPVYAPYREHVPPETAAMAFWLKNRRKDDWRDKRELEIVKSPLEGMPAEDRAVLVDVAKSLKRQREETRH